MLHSERGSTSSDAITNHECKSMQSQDHVPTCFWFFFFGGFIWLFLSLSLLHFFQRSIMSFVSSLFGGLPGRATAFRQAASGLAQSIPRQAFSLPAVYTCQRYQSSSAAATATTDSDDDNVDPKDLVSSLVLVCCSLIKVTYRVPVKIGTSSQTS